MSQFQEEYSIIDQSFEDLSLAAKVNFVILADKSYVSEKLTKELKALGQKLLIF